MLRGLGGFGLLLMVPAAGLQAQAIPTPQVGGGLATPGATGKWGLALTLAEGWTRVSGIGVTGVGVPPIETRDRFISSLDLTLSRNLKLGRSQLSASGGGVAIRDHLIGETFFTYNGRANLLYPVSRNVTLQAAGSSVYAYAQQVQVLTDAGLVLPLELTRTNSGSAALGLRLSSKVTASGDVRYDDINYRVRDTDVTVLSSGGNLGWAFTSKTRLNFDGRYDRVNFVPAQGPLTTPLGTVLDTNNRNVGAMLSHQFSRDHGTFLRYGFQRSRLQLGRDTDSHNLTLGWNWAISPTVALDLSGGASRYALDTPTPLDGVPLSGWTPTAGAGLMVRFRTEGTLNLRYQRSIQPAYGYGRDVASDYFSGAYNRVFGRRVSATATASYGIRQDLVDDTFDLRTTTLATNLRYALSPRFSFAGGYEYRHNSLQGPFSRPTTHQGTASLTYGYDWR